MWKQFTQWLQTKTTNDPKNFADIWPVDLHNHLLPGVDDGIANMEDTLLCLQQYVEWGIKRVICTPHISQDYHPNTPEQLKETLLLVEQAIAEANLPIDFSMAAEYLLDESFYDHLEKSELLSFGKDKYLLFETGWATAPHQLSQTLFLMQLKGYTPVLAHPERYNYYQSEPEHLMILKEKGCLFQINIMSLAGHYGKKAQQLAFKLLESKSVNFIGSDLHRPGHLPILEKALSPSTVELILQQPLLNSQLLQD
ncbi:capsular polysaccharide biosynthesis protein [Spirosoma harenae]